MPNGIECLDAHRGGLPRYAIGEVRPDLVLAEEHLTGSAAEIVLELRRERTAWDGLLVGIGIRKATSRPRARGASRSGPDRAASRPGIPAAEFVVPSSTPPYTFRASLRPCCRRMRRVRDQRQSLSANHATRSLMQATDPPAHAVYTKGWRWPRRCGLNGTH